MGYRTSNSYEPYLLSAATASFNFVYRLGPVCACAGHFFRAHASIEAQQNTRAIEMYEALLATFPHSPHVKCQLALARYNLREFDDAQAQFESLMAADPCAARHAPAL